MTKKTLLRKITATFK